MTGPASAIGYRTRGHTVWVVEQAAGEWEVYQVVGVATEMLPNNALHPAGP